MIMVQVLLFTILALGLFLLGWAVAALRASAVANKTLPAVGAAVGASLAVASLVALASIGPRGGGRQPPVRVSNGSQQGDIRPTSLVAGSRVWAAAQWNTASPGYALVRYSAGQPAHPVGGLTTAAIEHLAVQTRGSRELVYHVLHEATKLRIWDQGLRELPQASDGADHMLERVLDLCVEEAPLLLGRSKTSKGSRVGICRVADDGKTYTAMAGTFVEGSAARFLFGTGLHSVYAGYVTVDDLTQTLRIFARDGVLAYDKQVHAIEWLRVVRNEVFTSLAEKKGDAPVLWSHMSESTGLAKPEHLIECTAGLFVAADHASKRAVFQVAAGKGLLVAFDGAGDADRIHGVVVVNGILTVVASHGGECAVWEYNDTKLVKKPLQSKLPAGIEPRLVTANDEELVFFDKADTLWVVGPQGNTQGYTTKDTALYAPSNLVTMADHFCFVSKDKATGQLCLYSSYFL